MIEVYTHDHCQQCVFTKRVLKEKGVPFKEYKVTDELGRQLKEQYGIMSVPFVKVSEDNYWTGFNPARIQEVANEYQAN